MALGIFLVGVDEIDDVLAIRATAIDILKSGGTVMTGWTSEGTSVTKFQGMSVTTILQECNAFLQAADSGSYGTRITRTRPVYI